MTTVAAKTTPIESLKLEIEELIEKLSVRDDNFSRVDVDSAIERVENYNRALLSRIQELKEEVKDLEETVTDLEIGVGDLTEDIDELKEDFPGEPYLINGNSPFSISTPGSLLDQMIVAEFARCMKSGRYHEFLAYLESFK